MLNLFQADKTNQKGILNPFGGAFSLRFNCQTGAIMVGDTSHRGNKMAFTLLAAERLFGSLGMQAKPIQWLKIFFIPLPESGANLPVNTVCCALLKTAGMKNLESLITELVANRQSTADKVFELSFTRKVSDLGNYYVPEFAVRDRKGEAELQQFELIQKFMATQPRLYDSDTPQLIPIDGLSEEEIELLMQSQQQSAANETAITVKK